MAIKERSREESELVNRIIHACWPYAELFRINTGSVKTATGYLFSTGTPAGFPDIAGYARNGGSAVYIEVKVAPNKPTEKQIAFIEKAKASGCIAGICYSEQDARRLFEATE